MRKITFVLLIVLLSNAANAQVKADKVEFTDFIKEIIQTKKVKENMKQVWLLPIEYWEIALADSSFADKEIIDEIKSVFENYLIISCLDIDLKPFGALETKDIDISLITNDNSTHQAIPKESLNDDLKNMLNVLKPTLSNMLGQVGEQLQFFVFSNQDENNNPIITPYKNGKLTVIVNDVEFIYRTPFGSLVQAKVCPEDQQILNGNWEYCPWHGKKLKN